MLCRIIRKERGNTIIFQSKTNDLHEYTDINNKSLTFTSPGAFLKKNYFGPDDSEEKLQLKSMLLENILINLRTYDKHSLILYANDHLNNFIHLYISNGTNIVYLFNAGNEIKNITVSNPSTCQKKIQFLREYARAMA